MIIEVAEIKIEIKNRFDFLLTQCRDYICDGVPDFSVEVSDEDLEKERKVSGEGFSNGYLESVCAYREIGKHLPEYNAVIMHAACVEIDGSAYLFLAKSGTGKSTHIKFLRQLLGERISAINGDKPIIRIFNGVPYACGTAWKGKENWGENKKAPIKAICFLNRGEQNEIFEISPHEAVPMLMHQVFMPKGIEMMEKTLEICDCVLNKVKLYKLFCTPDLEAAKVSFNKMGE